MAASCKNLGDYYIQEADWTNALTQYKEEAEIHTQLKNKLKHAVANRWIGEAFLGLEKFDDSLKHVEMYLSE